MSTSSAEARYREVLRPLAIAAMPNARKAIPEFQVPRYGVRADLVVIGDRLDAYEIKTRRDSLKRLPMQVQAYSAIFDRCTLVAAETHMIAATPLLPPWWGVTAVLTPLEFKVVREPLPNPRINRQFVRMLMWRQELVAALRRLGVQHSSRGGCDHFGRLLMEATTPEQFSEIVRTALIERDPSKAAWPTRRYQMDTDV